MTGSKYNKTKKGQVLLIALMLMATVLTVILASSFRSTTETQITKLEEESQKALAAAEAGIEAALKQGSIADIRALPGLGNFTGSATIQTTQSPNFITPLLQKDEQYTLYLSTPQGAPDNPDFTNLVAPYFNGNLFVCFDNIAVEIIKINNDNTITRQAINPSGQTIIQNAPIANSGSNNCPNNNFANNYNLGSINLVKLLIVRVIGGSSKIGFQASTNLPPQGKTVVSEARSPAGATKKVTLFQSYPQIPAEFFVTSF